MDKCECDNYNKDDTPTDMPTKASVEMVNLLVLLKYIDIMP
jgi:hypothetical protein